MIADNLNAVRQRIAKCCEKIGRSPLDIQLVCVTKGASIGDIEAVIGLGEQILGENRVQEAALKYGTIGAKATWHLVGHLQTNKVKDAVRIFSLIHSVDSVRLASAINKEAAKIGKVQDILVEVNISGEETKFGVPPAGAIDLIKELAAYNNISLKGLMTIAPETGDPEKARPVFRALRELRDKINDLPFAISHPQHLSMGMSNDFEVAIEEGSSVVRIGRAIFTPVSI